MSHIVLSKSNDQLCSLLDRPLELKELLSLNDILLDVDKDVLFATRDEMNDNVWFNKITYKMRGDQVIEFKRLIGWVGERTEYIRKPRKVFGYADLLQLKSLKGEQ